MDCRPQNPISLPTRKHVYDAIFKAPFVPPILLHNSINDITNCTRLYVDAYDYRVGLRAPVIGFESDWHVECVCELREQVVNILAGELHVLYSSVEHLSCRHGSWGGNQYNQECQDKGTHLDLLAHCHHRISLLTFHLGPAGHGPHRRLSHR